MAVADPVLRLGNRAPVIHDGETVRCPNPPCGHTAPVWDWRVLGRPPGCYSQLLPVYKCRECGHIFAPLPAGTRLVPA